MESARVLQGTHLVGPTALKFGRELDLFLDHAPAVIATSLPAPPRTAPPRTAPAPTPSRAGPTPTRSGKAVERATRSDPYPRSPHDPPAAPGADSSLLDEAIVCCGEAELSRRCARHGSPLSAVAPSESAVARAAAANAVLSTYYPSVIRAGTEQRDQSCPLSEVKRTSTDLAKCPLLTQSGHPNSIPNQLHPAA